MTPPALWVGLGNPGPEHARNRHNIGFMAIERIAARHGFAPWRARFRGLFTEGTIAARKILALEPQTYMNASGESVRAAMGFYKLPLEHVVVFHDELDLDPGRVRVKKGGGNAGHNGLRSITQLCGGAEFWRVRLGIGHPGQKERVVGHVLGNFHLSDSAWLEPLLDRLAETAPLLAEGRVELFLNALNVATGRTARAPSA